MMEAYQEATRASRFTDFRLGILPNVSTSNLENCSDRKIYQNRGLGDLIQDIRKA